jgi:hypothetical protein
MWMGADDGTLQSAVRLLLKWGNPCGNLDLSMEIYYQGVNNPRAQKRNSSLNHELSSEIIETLCQPEH